MSAYSIIKLLNLIVSNWWKDLCSHTDISITIASASQDVTDKYIKISRGFFLLKLLKHKIRLNWELKIHILFHKFAVTKYIYFCVASKYGINERKLIAWQIANFHKADLKFIFLNKIVKYLRIFDWTQPTAKINNKSIFNIFM